MFLIQDFITFLNLHNGAKKKEKWGCIEDMRRRAPHTPQLGNLDIHSERSKVHFRKVQQRRSNLATVSSFQFLQLYKVFVFVMMTRLMSHHTY